MGDGWTALERLELEERRQAQFVALAAHELRAPATVVHGIAATLGRAGDELTTSASALLHDCSTSRPGASSGCWTSCSTSRGWTREAVLDRSAPLRGPGAGGASSSSRSPASAPARSRSTSRRSSRRASIRRRSTASSATSSRTRSGTARAGPRGRRADRPPLPARPSRTGRGRRARLPAAALRPLQPRVDRRRRGARARDRAAVRRRPRRPHRLRAPAPHGARFRLVIPAPPRAGIAASIRSVCRRRGLRIVRSASPSLAAPGSPRRSACAGAVRRPRAAGRPSPGVDAGRRDAADAPTLVADGSDAGSTAVSRSASTAGSCASGRRPPLRLDARGDRDAGARGRPRLVLAHASGALGVVAVPATRRRAGAPRSTPAVRPATLRELGRDAAAPRAGDRSHARRRAVVVASKPGVRDRARRRSSPALRASALGDGAAASTAPLQRRRAAGSARRGRRGGRHGARARRGAGRAHHDGAARRHARRRRTLAKLLRFRPRGTQLRRSAFDRERLGRAVRPAARAVPQRADERALRRRRRRRARSSASHDGLDVDPRHSRSPRSPPPPRAAATAPPSSRCARCRRPDDRGGPGARHPRADLHLHDRDGPVVRRTASTTCT